LARGNPSKTLVLTIPAPYHLEGNSGKMLLASQWSWINGNCAWTERGSHHLLPIRTRVLSVGWRANAALAISPALSTRGQTATSSSRP